MNEKGQTLGQVFKSLNIDIKHLNINNLGTHESESEEEEDEELSEDGLLPPFKP